MFNSAIMSEKLDHLSIAFPDQKNYEVSYGLAYSLALEKLTYKVDIEDFCRRSGSILITEKGERFIQLSYLNSIYRINLNKQIISKVGDDTPVELRDKILILHYLLTASGKPLSGDLISFKDLGEGLAYYPTFAQRAIQPLITCFGKNPDKLLNCAEQIGGVKSSFGDFAVTISAFARVPVTIVLWQGDDEFPPNANILFDRLVLEYLPLEDLIVLSQTIVWKLVKALKI